MKTPTNGSDSKYQERIEQIKQRDLRIEHSFRHTLHILEYIVAGITLIALIISLVNQLYEIFLVPDHLTNLNTFLHHILTIIVGLEFVRMIIDVTPANILEVLTVAITRYIILNHEDPWSNVASVICIAGLFATRRFLIRSSELKEDLVELE